MTVYRMIGLLVGPFRVGIFNVYNHLFHVSRAKVLVWNESDELLLVRSWGARQQWGLPGGGVKKGEDPQAAAQRELYEETGIEVPMKDFVYVATLYDQYSAPIFAVTVQKTALPVKPHNPREITHLQWFAVEGLPTDLSSLVTLALKSYQKENDIGIIK